MGGSGLPFSDFSQRTISTLRLCVSFSSLDPYPRILSESIRLHE